MPDVPIPLVGSSNQGFHIKSDSQRTVNLYPHKAEREGEKTKWFLIGTPGLEVFVELPESPIRGKFIYNNRLFVVAGPTIYEIYDDGTYITWGAIDSTEGRVSMDELADVLVIGDGAGFYALDINAAALDPIADAPLGRFCFAFKERMMYVNREDGQVFYSELDDPTNIPGLNFFTAEDKPDTITTAIATEEQIWLFGSETIEVWWDSGDTDNPFQRVQGGLIHSGIQAPDTALQLDGSLWYVEQDDQGRGIVRRTKGFTPTRVSTTPVERFTQTATNLSAYSYQEDGHAFYVLNADEGTWAYDLATQEWHERSYREPESGNSERHRAEIHAIAYGNHYVSDYETGDLYRMGLDLYDDAGDTITRKRLTGHVDLGGANVIVDELWVDLATGVGISSGQGSDPEVMLRYSVDGGQSFSNELTRKLGAIGETLTRVRFNRLGAGRDWVFEVSVSDPVKVVMLAATARVRVGRR